MKKIIVINGTGGSGKDSFVRYVSENANVYNFDSVHKIKLIAELVGWNGVTKTEKDRKFLSDLKRLTKEYNDMPYKEIVKGIDVFNENDFEIMFIHIREPEEIERIVKDFNATTLLIKRKGLDNITSNESDANVDNYNYDYIIENDTLEQLEKSAKEFISTLKEESNLKLKS